MKITRQHGVRKPLEIEFVPTFLYENNFLKIFGDSIDFSGNQKTLRRFQLMIPTVAWELFLKEGMVKDLQITFFKFAVNRAQIDLANIQDESTSETIILCGEGGKETTGTGYLYRIFIGREEIISKPSDEEIISKPREKQKITPLPEPKVLPFSEIISYAQVVYEVINRLGPECCEQLRRSLFITSSSSSYLVFSLLKEMNFFQPPMKVPPNRNSQFDITHFTLSEQAKEFFVADRRTFDLAKAHQNGDQLEVKIQWKFAIIAEIMQYVENKIGGPIERLTPIFPICFKPLSNDELVKTIFDAYSIEDIQKICLVTGFDADVDGQITVVRNLISESVTGLLDEEDYRLNDQNFFYGVESLDLKVLLRWQPKILEPIVELIEKKLALSSVEKERLLNKAKNDETNFSMSTADISTLLEESLEKNTKKALRKTIYGEKAGKYYNNMTQFMVRHLIHELGFYSPTVGDFVYLIKAGQEYGVYGVIENSHLFLNFLGWNSTILPLVDACIKQKMQNYQGEKPGDFISSVKIDETICKEVTEKLEDRAFSYYCYNPSQLHLKEAIESAALLR